MIMYLFAGRFKSHVTVGNCSMENTLNTVVTRLGVEIFINCSQKGG